MSFIGFTDARQWKLEEPLNSISDTNETIKIEPRSITDYFSMFLSGFKSIRKDNPDILITNNDGLAGFICVFLGLVFRKPTIIHLGGNCWLGHRKKLKHSFHNVHIMDFFKHSLFILLNHFTFRYVSGCFAVSETIKECVIENTTLTESSVGIVHTPIKRDHHQCINKSDSKRLLTVTNMDFKGKIKAIIHSLPAISRTLEEHPDWEYYIVGSGVFSAELEAAIEEACSEEVRDQIKVTGYVEDVEKLYSTSNIFIYPSFEDGYPSVVLEAQLFELPVICNRDQGMKEQITEGYNGYFVNINSHEAFSRKLGDLMAEPSMQEQLGKNGRRRVSEENSINRIGDDIKQTSANILS
ncbi:glycosyltransferase family 4 protein [Halovivax limisalsi]|uniref:glycosyltransferase family 4 protein n=1 Tax=Halovivax limisalsi TaxID=1453760 RepID=UPI001FFDAE14|nr:glycosyltransferase family 4 protein [Halovivax limisalsi]